MRKKILLVAIVVATVVGIISCGNNDGAATGSTSSFTLQGAGS